MSSVYAFLLGLAFGYIMGWCVRGVYDARLISGFREDLERAIRDL